MRTVNLRRVIRAPIHDVFDWLTDADNYRRVPFVRRAEVMRPGFPDRSGVGAIREVVTPLLSLTEQVVDYQRPVIMRYEITHAWPPLRHRDGYLAFRKVPVGTEVSWHTEYEVAVPLLSRLLTLLMHPIIRGGFYVVLRTAARDLERVARRRR